MKENPENVRKRLLEVRSTRNMAVRVPRTCLLCGKKFMIEKLKPVQCPKCTSTLVSKTGNKEMTCNDCKTIFDLKRDKTRKVDRNWRVPRGRMFGDEEVTYPRY